MTAHEKKIQELVSQLEKYDDPELAKIRQELAKTITGKTCSECGGPIRRPKRGLMPSVCGATCRKRRSRRRKAERLVADVRETRARLDKLHKDVNAEIRVEADR